MPKHDVCPCRHPLRYVDEHECVLLSAARDVARGMHYLHSHEPPILHRMPAG